MSKNIIDKILNLSKKREIKNLATKAGISSGNLSDIRKSKNPTFETLQKLTSAVGAEILLSAPDERTHPEILEIARQKIAEALTPIIKEKGLKVSDFQKIVNAEQYSIDEFFSLLAILDIHLELSEKDAGNNVWEDANPDNLN